MPLLGDIAMIFIHLHTLFDHIWTNLLTQCTPVPVSVFCCFCISGFSITKTVRKIPEKIYKKSAFLNLPEPRSTAGGGPPGAEATWWRGPPPWPRRGGAWAPQVPPDATLWPIFKARLETLETGALFHDRISIPPPLRFQDRERQENSSRHPAGGEDHHWDLLHHHGRLPDDARVVSLGPWVHDQ